MVDDVFMIIECGLTNKYSHAGTAAERIHTLKRESKSVNRIGSGDLLDEAAARRGNGRVRLRMIGRFGDLFRLGFRGWW